MRLVPESELSLSEVAKLVLGMKGGITPAKDVDKKQLAIGMVVELEHTNDPKVAERIARQHLAEEPEYYTKPMKKNWGANEAKDKAEELAKAASAEKTWRQIEDEEDPDGKNHDLKLTCTKCGNSQTCRCSKPKRTFSGICPSCVDKSEDDLKGELGQKAASVFIFEDDPERMVVFNKVFGVGSITTTSNVSEALSMLRTGNFSRIYLDRDVSNPNENGEDLAWQMEKEQLCSQVPVIIHSENTRGQKVMARYLGRYNSNVSVIPFKHLKKQLDIPGVQL